VGSADADVVEAAVDPEGDLAVGVDAVAPDAVVGVVVAACGGGGFGASLVGHGRGRSAGQGPVGALLVVCAGINRHGEGDERALHRRSSDPRWPQVMRRHP
jgi:hypothetical protein